MQTTASIIYNRYRNFEQWFNKRFGWFFTNGNKIVHYNDNVEMPSSTTV